MLEPLLKIESRSEILLKKIQQKSKEMFRATHFPSFSSSSLRIPLLSSLPFSSSLKPYFVSSLSTAPPQIPRSSRPPIGNNSTSRFFRRSPSIMANPRVRGRALFSGGSSSGRENKELLVQHLLVGEDNLKLLVELQQRISGGVDLSDLAVEYSICPSKENGGMLGWIRRGQTVPEFEDAAFNAPVNKVVRCKTKFGWHLLQVLSEREECILQDIEPLELHSKMQYPSFVEEAQLIDVREPEEVAQASLPGFKVLPLRQFGTWGSVIMDEFDPEKDTYVLGFKRVFNVAGGIHAYAVKADSSIPTY
ncbi:rhodanese-like/PpiC domain-containing protein 12, chloroplastic isoform X2 [Ananas comosus]|uniref:Rhodanese-like/PpiC domain-containing protein 12, chloroplastic isoform X2 n=1 Tax=Ananas comosus TaxID=4615 RepID=A0A6P5GL26_ANACO|nr:rhodanese-like/PpiC domain-containing protein 12, chloroplastic isoform X2 [Ananas comosus]